MTHVDTCNSSTMIELNIKEIESEYDPSFDMFTDEEWSYIKLKQIIYKKLTDTERRVILCYAQIGNLRDTAKVFHVSTSTIWNYITKIRDKVKLYYENS